MTRDEAINTLHELWRETHDPWYEETYEMAVEALSEEEDPVRCGECLHMKVECGDEGTCFFWCKHWENATDSWGWCYYGERIEP